MARAAAEAGILGARGNCGMILSHFLLGFADGIGERARLTVEEFVEALRVRGGPRLPGAGAAGGGDDDHRHARRRRGGRAAAHDRDFRG